MSNFTVFTGIWTDHSNKGLGATTLTLSVTSASLLVSALATFITLIGARFWSIVAYIIHQIRATDSAADGVHHQHQVVYRNASSHLTAVWYIIRIGWAWRGRAGRLPSRTLLSLLPPLLTFVGFAIASIFSGKVTHPAYATSKVLVQPQNCGFLEWNDAFIKQNGSTSLTQWGAKLSIQALDYARGCYEEDDTSSVNCDVFPVQTLPYQVETNVSCPLANGRCWLGSNTAYKLSTPWFDSHSDFEVNDSPGNRVGFRREMTCSIINLEGVVTNLTSSMGNIFYSYYLGQIAHLSSQTFMVANTVHNGGFFGYALS
jgi:hypothetical protein